ncbi:MAG: hypothetical protein GY847_00725 [Proteobacteria bacterium]|nr:hypothetical protein [Pseudomonadota bacterium]
MERERDQSIDSFLSALDERAFANSDLENAALTDNWLLELSARQLLTMNSSRDRDLPYLPYIRNILPVPQKGQIPDGLDALIHLLDLIVLHEKIVYDPQLAIGWKELETLKPIEEVLLPTPIVFDRDQYDHVTKLLLPEYENSFRSGKDAMSSAYRGDERRFKIVGVGATYYLALSNLMNAYYWPAPMRREFLEQHVYRPLRGSFSVVIRRNLRSRIEALMSEALADLELATSQMLLPSLGSTVLAECVEIESILPAAMQLRRSKEAREFRKWIAEMDEALQVGDVMSLRMAFKDLADLDADVRKSLSLGTDPGDSSLEVTLGISPSLTFNSDFFARLRTRFRRKRFHVSFLRSYYDACLRNANLAENVRRLFGEAGLGPSRQSFVIMESFRLLGEEE